MSEELIAQIVDRLPSLTEAQILALNSVDTSVYVDSMLKAIEAGVEEATALVMLQFGDDTDPGVWAIARIAILGILAQGKIDSADSALLIRAWTDVIEPFEGQSVEERLPLEPEVVAPVAEVAEVAPVAETPVEPLDDVAPVADPEAGVI